MIKLIKTAPGEAIDFATEFEENQSLGDKPARVGRVERLDYTTSVYEDGVTYKKYCNVYLPWCYDHEDKSRKYNVLYYQHGNTCDLEIFVEPENKVFMDNLFSTDELDPCIIVSTTYYFDVTKDVETRRTTGQVPAGDGDWPHVVGNFYKEVIDDIVPLVEMKYNTYLTEPTKEGIKATRDHRAFTGYSRGSVFTWKMFHYCIEYFRWFAPMSCYCTAEHSVWDDVPIEEIIDYVKYPIEQHPELPFYIYASNGHPNDIKKMTPQMNELLKLDCFSYGKDPKVNNIYFALSAFAHTDVLVPSYYYNSLTGLFKV